jgi:hypothetical protein
MAVGFFGRHAFPDSTGSAHGAGAHASPVLLLVVESAGPPPATIDAAPALVLLAMAEVAAMPAELVVAERAVVAVWAVRVGHTIAKDALIGLPVAGSAHTSCLRTLGPAHAVLVRRAVVCGAGVRRVDADALATRVLPGTLGVGVATLPLRIRDARPALARGTSLGFRSMPRRSRVRGGLLVAPTAACCSCTQGEQADRRHASPPDEPGGPAARHAGRVPVPTVLAKTVFFIRERGGPVFFAGQVMSLPAN